MNSQDSLRLIATIAALLMLGVAPDAAAQAQRQFGLIAADRAPCTEFSNIKHKLHLTSLPENVITPARTKVEGWPDLQGSWTSRAYSGNSEHSIETGHDPAGIVIQCWDAKTNMWNPQTGAANLLIDPMRGMVPYQPWAQAKRMEYMAALYAPAKRMDLDVDARCVLPGVPRAASSADFELRFTPDSVVFFGGFLPGKGTRIVPMDGRPHVGPDVMLYMGDSRGRWEGNTLVIETTNNREETWFDKHGTFHSEALRVVERLTMIGENTLYWEATIEDPAVYTQTWKMAMTFDRAQGPRRYEAREDTCHEGERSVDTMVRAGLRARAAGIKGYHVHVDLVNGKAIRADEQKYLDESRQPIGHSYAPAVE
jgi:hypothetical protein